MSAYRRLGIVAVGCLLCIVGCTKPQDPGKGYVGAPPGQLTDQYLQFQSQSPIQFTVTFAVGGAYGYKNPCLHPGGPLSSGGTNIAQCELDPALIGQISYEATVAGAGGGPMIVRSCGGCQHGIEAGGSVKK